MPLVGLSHKNYFLFIDTFIDNIKAKDLELYAIMGEHDNAGIPLAYCLLSTASSLTPGKQKPALTSFMKCVRDKYDVHPMFVHTDKDIVEIKAAQTVWVKLKASTLLAASLKGYQGTAGQDYKLSTTPYNVEVPHTEASFISIDFVLFRKADPSESEDHNILAAQINAISNPNPSLTPNPNVLPIKIKIPQGMRFPASQSALTNSSEDSSTKSTHSFCTAEPWNQIVDIVEHHLCAHPLAPGCSAPSPQGICYWAVREIYQYCVMHILMGELV